MSEMTSYAQFYQFWPVALYFLCLESSSCAPYHHRYYSNPLTQEQLPMHIAKQLTSLQYLLLAL